MAPLTLVVRARRALALPRGTRVHIFSAIVGASAITLPEVSIVSSPATAVASTTALSGPLRACWPAVVLLPALPSPGIVAAVPTFAVRTPSMHLVVYRLVATADLLRARLAR